MLIRFASASVQKRMLAHEMGVDWNAYEAFLQELDDA